MLNAKLLKYWNDIPTDKKKAVSYEYLCAKWQCNHRRVRRILEQLGNDDNGDDYILIRSSHSRGFFRTKDRQLICRYEREVTNRANNVLKPKKKIDRVLARLPF